MAEEILRPALSVVAGTPTPQELAALVVVLGLRARRAEAAAVAGDSTSAWRAGSRRTGLPLPAGPGAWRASGLPR